MGKIQVTQQQRDNAIDALENMWPSVPPKNVYPSLRGWRAEGEVGPPDCGTVACFGGWCAWWPNFVRQGIFPSYAGMPLIKKRSAGICAAEELFGISAMFEPRDATLLDWIVAGTDHELVTHRLKWLIANSEVVT